MQRSRDACKVAYRIFQGSGASWPEPCPLMPVLETQRQPRFGLIEQQVQSLRTQASPQQTFVPFSSSFVSQQGNLARDRAFPGVMPGSRMPAFQSWAGLLWSRRLSTESLSKHKPQTRSKKLEGKRSLWSGLLLLAPGVLAGFLGKWQLDRRNWKLDLLKRRELMLLGQPLDLFEAEDSPPEYTRVRAAGVLLHDQTVFVGPRARSVMGKAQKGYIAVTPLYNQRLRRTVLVNRGWVPAAWKESPEERGRGELKGELVAEGILREGEQAGEFVPDNVPAKGEWYYVNPAEIAQACGLPPETPLIEVVAGERPAYREPTAMELLGGKRALVPKPVDEFPLAKSADDFMHWSVMPQDHMNYALTWFTLSGFVSLMAVKAIRQGLRR